MSNLAKGPRLYLRAARDDRKATWIILDTVGGSRHEESTECSASDRVGAERKLGEYLAGKHVTIATANQRDPASIPVADVLALYARDKVKAQARPKEALARIGAMLDFFGGDTLANINGERCREYAATMSPAAARRQLEDLRSAINHHRREGKCSQVVEVVLPQANPARERWLTRHEVAKLLLHCWRHPERKHVARAILMLLYTGSRASVAVGAALEPMPGRGWVDLENGVFYRRAPRTKQTKKRAPSIRPPTRLLAHAGRWKRRRQRFAVEYMGEPVKRISKAFAGAVDDCKLGADVVIHTFRHTAITWAMQRSADPWQVCGYFGISMELLMERYGHHHPDYQSSARAAFDRPARPTVGATVGVISSKTG